MAIRTRTLRSWETRRYSCTITTDVDPTGDTVEWAAVAVAAVSDPATDPGSWTAGSWNGTFDSAALTAESYSPSFGTSESTVSPDVTLTEGTTYYVYCRVRNATDAPGDLVAVIDVI